MPRKKISRKKVSEKKEIVPTEEDTQLEDIDSDLYANDYLMSWEAPEFIYHEKNTLWFILAGAVFLVLIVISLIAKQWLAIIMFLILGYLVFHYAEVKPKDVEISITNVGITFGNNFYTYNKLKSFWIIYEPPTKTLNLESTKRFSPIITVQLEDTDPAVVRSILKEHLVEEPGRTEDFVDKLSRFLRF